jgi:hypothetical protein
MKLRLLILAHWRMILLILMSLLGLSFGLAWVSTRFSGVQGWGSFFIALLIATGIILISWAAVKRDQRLSLPEWLLWLVIGAALLRLCLGAFWFISLPVMGYGSRVENQGYIMADAQSRDRNAWFLADSTKPLWTVIHDLRQVDQYVGMLYLSASVYRYLGSDFHQPLLMVVFSAAFSSLAVLFTYAFTKRGLGDQAARLAAWIVAFYPEAVLLGSSQMREAYLMTLVAVSSYGVIRFWQDRVTSSLVWLMAGLLLAIPFSPPMAAFLLLIIIALAFAVEGRQVFHQPKFWLLLGGFVVVAGIGVWIAWDIIAPKGVSNPVSLIGGWLQDAIRWQTLFVKRASGTVRSVFRMTPAWAHGLILMVFGIAQPFLPAALLDDGLPIWRGIAIWRAAGWTMILPFLLAVPFLMWKRSHQKGLLISLTVAVWLGILVASLRSGGDLWDNPRYRVMLISLEAALVAWVWLEVRRQESPWLYRMIVSVCIMLAWFFPWYFQRYNWFEWPVEELFKTIGLGVACVYLYLLQDIARLKYIEISRSDK